MVFTEIGALNILITNPRDIPGFIKRNQAIPGDGDDRGEHPV